MFSRALKKNQDFFMYFYSRITVILHRHFQGWYFLPAMAISQYWVNWWMKLKIANFGLIRVVLSALNVNVVVLLICHISLFFFSSFQVRCSRYNPHFLEPTLDKTELASTLDESDLRRFRPIKAARTEQTTSLFTDPKVEWEHSEYMWYLYKQIRT